ncbi:hypothetical protein M422DRAFT_200532 [Sphaerobolus stellatus SS14]|nr:hypothetical protein M422DRAFT_200532 [Sphaerobolus stellatus SS14]
MRVFQSPAPLPTCFFCLTPLSKQPRNSRSFKCPECDCWNRYDERGEIMSDEPAMHEESMNTQSYAKRASPSKSRFPTTYSKTPFCHTCLTNQTLLVNLLSNYLPPSDDPTYEARLAEMPAYTESLQERYPPVCNNCRPIIDEELKSKEQMARTSALGGWLKRSRHAGAQRSTEQLKGRRDVLIWRIRGGLWTGTLLAFLGVDLAGTLDYNLRSLWLAIFLPILAFVSLFWTFWDPTWSTVRLSRLQGRGFTVAGRGRYIQCQMILWVSRLVTAILLILSYRDYQSAYITAYTVRCWYTTALATEVVLTGFSISSLRINRPPKVRLLEPRRISSDDTRNYDRSRSTTPMPSSTTSKPEFLFAGMSIEPKAPSPTMPVFGRPSFPSHIPPSDVQDEDMMDWTPENGSPQKAIDHDNWLRPQRFFPPQKATGLEDLFATAAKLNTDEDKRPKAQHRHQLEQVRKEQHQKRLAGQIRELGMFVGAAVAIGLITGLGVYRF